MRRGKKSCFMGGMLVSGHRHRLRGRSPSRATSAGTRAALAAAAVLLTAACGGSVASNGAAGAGGTGGAAGAGGSGGSAGTKTFPCVDPQPLLVGGQDTGYDTCQGGFLRRRKAVECPDLLSSAKSCPGGGDCTTDADCGASNPYGHCAIGGGFVCQCMPGCRTDADCGAGNICLCADPIGQCVKSSCTTDASCGGRLCTSYVTDGDCHGKGFACQTAGDKCASDSDCSQYLQCGYNGAHRVCKDIGCAL